LPGKLWAHFLNTKFSTDAAATDQQTNIGAVIDPTRNMFVILDMQVDAPETLLRRF
jgi:hypothetical protein